MATTVTPQGRAQVHASIREFFEALFASHQPPLPAQGQAVLQTDWQRTVLFVRRAARTIGASCKHYDSSDNLESRTWNIMIPNTYLENPQALAQCIANVPAPAWLVQELTHCAAMPRRTTHKLVLVQLWPVYARARGAAERDNNGVEVSLNDGSRHTMYWRPNDRNNHSALLLFDLQRGTQEFHDPHGEAGEAIRYSAAFAARPAFVPAACPRVVPLARTVFPQGDSLQAWLQQRAAAQSDLCTACCYLVVFVCLRFGLVSLHSCAGLIKAAYGSRTAQAQRLFARRFIAWCNAALRDDPAHDLHLPIVITPSNRCAIVCKSTGRQCSRRRCGTDFFCWQHRHLWRNPFAVPPRRMACAKPLVQQPRPAGLPANVLD